MEGTKKKINWECADFLEPLTDGETETEIVFVRWLFSRQMTFWS